MQPGTLSTTAKNVWRAATRTKRGSLMSRVTCSSLRHSPCGREAQLHLNLWRGYECV
ncbi:hypothetical protein E2C01_084747 [Portunus trituberculatus]|uniref:Uncharacterized protein n=1 Tax=Portunus trituberculatus TaxID=210409 RepID=A0A5B7J8K1_PORTR|nr:hypothetical protein [Portunus trituberculatus]